MTQLIAKSPVFYGTRTHRRGEVFEAQPRHVEVLLRVGKAERVAAEVEPAPARKKYRRRDLRAED